MSSKGTRRKERAKAASQRSFLKKGTEEGEWSVDFGGGGGSQGTFFADAATTWTRENGTALIFCDTRPFSTEYRNVIAFTLLTDWYEQFKANTLDFYEKLSASVEGGIHQRVEGLSAPEVRDRIQKQESPAWGTVLACAANTSYFGSIAEVRFYMIKPNAAHRATKGEIVPPQEGVFSPWVVYTPTVVLYEMLREIYESD